MFTKRYKDRRLSFEVQILPDFTISLIRLPVVKVDHDAEVSLHSEQMCTVVHVECLPEWAIESSMTAESMVDFTGLQEGPYVVAEYIGRESSSENLDPDTALDGFLDWELEVALETLSRDNSIADYIKSHYGIKNMLIS